MWIWAVAGAAEVVVPSGGSIQAALSVAAPGDVLRIRAGTYREALHATVPVTLRGEGLVTLVAPSEASVLIAAADLSIENVEIDGEGVRRAIYVLGTNVTLVNSTLRNGFSPGEGGLVRVDGGSLVTHSTLFEFGHALFDGGLVHVNQAGTFHALGDVTFRGGVADDDGGALYAADNTIVALRGVVFENNTAQEGGAVHVASTQLVVAGARFAQNTAGDFDVDRGGALHVNGGTVADVSYASFDTNTAASGPGLAASNQSTLLVRHSDFRANTATHNSEGVGGGALRCHLGSDCTIEDSWFEDNTSRVGAGISSNQASQLLVRRSVVCGNQPTFGSVSAISTDHVEISNTILAGNDAQSEGALDLFQLSGPVTVRNNHFVGNSAHFDSAVSLSADGGHIVDFRNNLVFGNEGFQRPAVSGQPGFLADYNLYAANVPSDTDAIGPNDLFIDPQLPSASPGCHIHEWLVPSSSPAIDAGDPNIVDANGSPADIGAFGGPGGPALGDADGDGVIAMLDCDDLDVDVYPFAPELCDGVDNDCNGLVDDADGAVEGLASAWRDGDGDGFGDPDWPATTCQAPAGWVSNSDDCDDTDASVNPESVWYLDGDGDGFGDPLGAVTSCIEPGGHVFVSGDCNDGDASIRPGAPEACDGEDNDCDMLTDEDIGGNSWFEDGDGDGYGAGPPIDSCVQPLGTSADGTDCDDDSSLTWLGAPELCDGEDNDCNDLVDDGTTPILWYPDDDGDGFGDGVPVEDCNILVGFSPEDGDCDDSNPSASPVAVEVCDQVDNDCDGVVDANAIDALLGWPDADLDGYGAGIPEAYCTLPAGTAPVDGDCDDTVPSINPGAPEFCDGLDQNCDQVVDEDVVDVDWYADDDGDGFGDPNDSVSDCLPIPGRVLDATDCDDQDPGVNPDAPEVPGNGVDDNCDGSEGNEDSDGDGLSDALELALGTDPGNPDTDGDGLGDAEEAGLSEPLDTDGDGLINALDPDDDGDGLLTAEEGSGDADSDGLPNHLDLDSDGDGAADGAEGLGDQDGDGIPDFLDPGGNGPATAPAAPKTGFGCSAAPSSVGVVPWLLLALALRKRSSCSL